MNGALLRHTWRLQQTKLASVSIALTVWGFLLPVIYARFGSQFTALMESGLLPEQFARFGGGDVFSLSGSIALGFIHPIAIILTSVFAVGFSASAVAGERQRGTLEVALARPISRRVFYLSLLAASFGFIYDRALIELAEQVALDEKIQLRRGVFVAVPGPNLETRAEYRFLRAAGADVVGMSTVPEVIVAVHQGTRAIGFSVITDSCLPDSLKPAHIPEILAAAAAAEPKLKRLVLGVLRRM